MVTLVINTGGLREAYKCTVQREVNVKKPQNKKGRSGPEPSCKAKEEEEKEEEEKEKEEVEVEEVEEKKIRITRCLVNSGSDYPLKAMSYPRRMKSSVTLL